MKWLENKKINVVYFTVSFLIVLISYIVNINFREYLITIALSESIFWLSVPVLFFSIVTLVTRNRVSKSWIKFTNYFYIISIVIILITPTSTHGMDFFPIIKETVTIALAIIYSTISLFLILYKSFKKQ